MRLSSKVLTLLEVGNSIWRHSFIELLLSHESVMANASIEQLKEISKVTMRNMSIKEQQPRLYGQTVIESSAYLLCTTLTKQNGGAALSHELKKFLEDGTSRDITVVSDDLRRNYIKF